MKIELGNVLYKGKDGKDYATIESLFAANHAYLNECFGRRRSTEDIPIRRTTISKDIPM
ncbi:MAG: hypothetical protein M1268_02530 [Patescibacteria group bacterium]|nr:hypothetical protein [Patescibacteria group bacterium]